ncbi:MAG: hypothetical protein LBK60_00300 [Verrucomicrobiales bacterium]|jgi:hypothetical protein|nr:hypothetical protein [Verrucomicrobiales bacterium]
MQVIRCIGGDVRFIGGDVDSGGAYYQRSASNGGNILTEQSVGVSLSSQGGNHNAGMYVSTEYVAAPGTITV